MYKSYVPYLQHILDECLYVRSVIKDTHSHLRTWLMTWHNTAIRMEVH